MTFKPDPVTHADLIGLDLAVMFKDSWSGDGTVNSAVIDNVRVTDDSVPPPPSGTVIIVR